VINGCGASGVGVGRANGFTTQAAPTAAKIAVVKPMLAIVHFVVLLIFSRFRLRAKYSRCLIKFSFTKSHFGYSFRAIDN
jgi:uncharacterized membrane protein YtjA (UPF0391 family)